MQCAVSHRLAPAHSTKADLPELGVPMRHLEFETNNWASYHLSLFFFSRPLKNFNDEPLDSSINQLTQETPTRKMLTPTVANHFSFFYAVGNTPAINLARSVPHGQDVSALSLGCGDLRNLLYTAYIEDGLRECFTHGSNCHNSKLIRFPAERNLDFTFCDIDEKIIGLRTIVHILHL